MTNKYRTDCVYYHVEQDMGAQVSCCCKETCFGYCPCIPDCKNYVRENVAGEWITRRDGYYQCSQCGEKYKQGSNFCPSCGARMKLLPVFTIS